MTSPSPVKKRIGRVDNDLKAAAVVETPLRETDRNREDSMKKKRELQKARKKAAAAAGDDSDSDDDSDVEEVHAD